ncbi:hypothetical protein CCO04_04145 [Pimelobacter sp. 30-1]|nr:hypothetical protein [Pimelobacter sp. 30-1]
MVWAVGMSVKVIPVPTKLTGAPAGAVVTHAHVGEMVATNSATRAINVAAMVAATLPHLMRMSLMSLLLSERLRPLRSAPPRPPASAR